MRIFRTSLLLILILCLFSCNESTKTISYNKYLIPISSKYSVLTNRLYSGAGYQTNLYPGLDFNPLAHIYDLIRSEETINLSEIPQKILSGKYELVAKEINSIRLYENILFVKCKSSLFTINTQNHKATFFDSIEEMSAFSEHILKQNLSLKSIPEILINWKQTNKLAL